MTDMTTMTDAELDRYEAEGNKLFDAGRFHGLTMAWSAATERDRRLTAGCIDMIQRAYG